MKSSMTYFSRYMQQRECSRVKSGTRIMTDVFAISTDRSYRPLYHQSQSRYPGLCDGTIQTPAWTSHEGKGKGLIDPHSPHGQLLGVSSAPVICSYPATTILIKRIEPTTCNAPAQRKPMRAWDWNLPYAASNEMIAARAL